MEVGELGELEKDLVNFQQYESSVWITPQDKNIANGRFHIWRP